MSSSESETPALALNNRASLDSLDVLSPLWTQYLGAKADVEQSCKIWENNP